jgi:hypothetical protein
MTTEDAVKTAVPSGASPAEAQNTGNGSQTEDKTVPYERFKEVNSEAKELRKKLADYEAQQTAAAAQAKADQEKQLADQAQWQTLAEQRAQELANASTERDSLRQQAATYEAALKAVLETQRKDLPPHILTLLDRLNPAEQLEYLAKNQTELTKGTTQPGTPNPQRRTNTPTPDPNRKPYTL